VAVGGDRTEVDERAADGGRRDAVQLRDVLRVEPADAVQVDAGALGTSAVRRHGHIDSRAGGGDQAPETSRRPVTQHGLWPTRKDSTEELALGAQLSMPEGVHPAPQGLEPPRRDTVLDRAVAEPAFPELPERHHPELSRSDGGHGPVRGRWCNLGLTVRRNLHHRASVTGPGALGCCRL
jgi:hypothetical protein